VPVTLERRAYGPDATAEENDAIRARVTAIGDRTVLYEELPIMTAHSAGLCLERARELAEPWDALWLIVDVRDVIRPDAPSRHAIRNGLRALGPKLRGVYLIPGENVAVRMALTFLFRFIGFSHWRVVGSVDEALAARDDAA